MPQGPHEEPGSPTGSRGRQSHYFDPEQTSAHRPRRIELDLPDLPELSVSLETDSGVFSAGRLDPGTRLLLTRTTDLGPSLPPGDLVDLGAGYGPIAVTAALRWPDREVWAVEPNQRARLLCERNARLAGVHRRVHAVEPGAVPADARIAAVLSNPPIRIGKAALHELLSNWLDRLDPGGEAWLVVARNLGADSLARWLRSGGLRVERVASRRGYRLLRVLGGPGAPGDAG